MTTRKQAIPDSLANDPRIDEVETSYGGDRRWLIHLRPGWCFPDGGHTKSFDTVKEFRTFVRTEPK